MERDNALERLVTGIACVLSVNKSWHFSRGKKTLKKKTSKKKGYQGWGVEDERVSVFKPIRCMLSNGTPS